MRDTFVEDRLPAPEALPDFLPLYLLWSTAAAAFVLGSALHRGLYATGFSKAQESAQRFVRARSLTTSTFSRNSSVCM